MDKQKLLVIDDEHPIRTILKQKLTEEGYEIILAMDGEEALEKALSEHPNLIILDLILPKMDGLTVLKKLREDQWGREVPVIILSNISYSDLEYQNKIGENLKLDKKLYIEKAEVKLEDLVKVIEQTLEKDNSKTPYR